MRAVEPHHGVSGHEVPERVPSRPPARKSGSAPLIEPLQPLPANRDAVAAPAEQLAAIVFRRFAVIGLSMFAVQKDEIEIEIDQQLGDISAPRSSWEIRSQSDRNRSQP